jgi:hypothetical protein
MPGAQITFIHRRSPQEERRIMPERIQLSRRAGWRMPPNTVKVDRSTRWGNPFRTHGDGVPMDAALAVSLFESMLAKEGGFLAEIRGRGRVLTELADIRREPRGKNLACWCKPGTPCHADVLLRLANQPEGAACAR